MISASALRLELETRLQQRIPAALSPAPRPEAPALYTGIIGIECPLSGLTEICAPGITTSGRTSLLLSLMAQVTAQEMCCALVDACDAFDPASASASGVDMERLLWI